ELERGVLQDKTTNALLLLKPGLGSVGNRILVRSDLRAPNEVQDFVQAHYQEVRWFNRLYKSWSTAVNAVSVPRKKGWRFAGALWPAIPIFYPLAIAGLIVTMTQKSALRSWHISLGISFLCMTLVVFMTANVRGRFRFFLE